MAQTKSKTTTVTINKVDLSATIAAQFNKMTKAGDTKSARIRYLSGAGCTRSEIAKVLNIRYQHVRNVLITPVGEQKSPATA